MANCPNCGSEHIQLKKDTNVDWGRAVAGWALFGVVGGAVGAVTGEDRNANTCLDCGTSWKAEDLYKTLQVIKKLTGVQLDLAYEEDRYFINDFISEITPYIEIVSRADEKASLILKRNEEQIAADPVTFFIYSAFWYLCVLGIYLVMIIILTAIIGGVGIILSLIGIPFVKKVVDREKNKEINKEKAKRKKETSIAKIEAKKNKVEAKEKLDSKIEEFMINHPL